MKKLFILTVMLAAALGCMAAKPVQLSLNLEKGKTYGIDTESSTTIKQNVMGQSINMTVQISGSIRLKVEDADAEGYGMSVWYERVAMKMSGPMTMAADSENADAGDPLSAAIKAITGKQFSIKMGRNGKVVSVGGTEEMIDAVFEEMSKQFPQIGEEQIEMVRGQLESSYGGDAFKGSLESGMVAFPDKPVAVGDSWNDRTGMKSQFSLDADRVFTVVKIGKKSVAIRSEAAMSTDPDEAPASINGMEAKYNMKGSMASETIIDRNSGWTVSGDAAQNLSGEVKILPGAQMPNGFTIPMTMYTVTTTTGNVAE